MSEQYQRFKQNFLRQHPPSSTEQKNIYQTSNKSFKHYDPYNEYTSERNSTYRNEDDRELQIENETHFPFEEIEQTTFQDLQNDPFFTYKQHKHSFANNNLQQSNTKNYHVEEKNVRTYKQSHENLGKNLPMKTDSQFRTLTKQKINRQDNYLSAEQSGIDKINREIDKLRLSKQENLSHHISPNASYLNEFQQRARSSAQNGSSQHNYQINKQYVVQNFRTNNLLPVSPPKQLPVIYNRPNSTSNSQHKVNPVSSNPSNSRVIIQQGPPPNKGSVFLCPPPNPLQPLQPVIINHPQSSHLGPQSIGSGSRVIIQSETIGQSKGIIQSSQNINSPPGLIIQQQPAILTSPPHIRVESQHYHLQEGTISVKEYERLKTECSMWQQKFFQANDHLTKLQSQRTGESYGNGVSQQTILIKEENTRLMEKIRTLQSTEHNSYDRIKVSYEELMKKYQNSLMKEANLLVDRFRLQMKHNERY